MHRATPYCWPTPTASSWTRWPNPARSSARAKSWCVLHTQALAKPSSNCLKRCVRPSAPGARPRCTADQTAVPAKLRQLSSAADPLTRTYEAGYVLESALAHAPLGATVTIRIPDKESSAQTGMQVPIGAFFDPGKGTGAWVVTGNPAHVAWRPVKVL